MIQLDKNTKYLMVNLCDLRLYSTVFKNRRETMIVLKKCKQTFLFWLCDAVIVLFSCIFAELFIHQLTTVFNQIIGFHTEFYFSFLLILLSYSLVFFAMKLYNNIWVYATIIDYMKIVVASALSWIIIGIAGEFIENVFDVNLLNPKELFLAMFMSVIGIAFFRIFIRIVSMVALRGIRKRKNAEVNLLIIGAGLAGKRVIDSANSTTAFSYHIVGLIDDDPLKYNAILSGIRVLGNRNDIINVCASNEVDEIIIAMPSATNEQVREILSVCSQTDCKVKILPEISESLIPTDNYLKRTRDVQIEDLLPRDPIVLDTKGISEVIEDKVVLVSGGGGSIGSELCRQIASFNPRTLIVVDIYENNAYDLQMEMKMKYPFLNLVVLIASVRDSDRLNYIFKKYKPDVVFHAAAHKHVPLMEDSPGEAVKNNVFGTYNIAKCSSENNVKKFIMISTDKAVNPTNIMGATKRICEMIVQSFNTVSDTEFVAVRFGNVLGSNGSVIPLFKKQIEQGGPVTVTHKEVTRFFMTIPEAAQLVLQASVYAKGGEIFVLDMGKPVKIYDLAVNLIRLSGFRPGVDMEIKVTGLRPGEKLYEELLMTEEGLSKTAHSKIFVGQPTFLNIDELGEKLDILKDALNTKDNELIMNAVAQVVPTYARTDNKEYIKK